MKRARSVSGDATTALGGSAAGAKRRSGGLSGLLRDALAASTQQVHAMVPRARRAKAQRTYAHEQTAAKSQELEATWAQLQALMQTQPPGPLSDEAKAQCSPLTRTAVELEEQMQRTEEAVRAEEAHAGGLLLHLLPHQAVGARLLRTLVLQEQALERCMTEESFLALQGDVPELAPAWDALNTLSASSNDPLTLPELEHLQQSASQMPAATAVPAASAGVPSLSQRGGRPAVSSRPAASAGTRSNRSGGATLRASPFVALPSSSSDDDDGRGDEDDDDDSDDGFVSKLRASSVGTRAARSVGGGGGGGGGGAAPAAASGERAGSVSRGRGTTSARSGHVANKPAVRGPGHGTPVNVLRWSAFAGAGQAATVLLINPRTGVEEEHPYAPELVQRMKYFYLLYKGETPRKTDELVKPGAWLVSLVHIRDGICHPVGVITQVQERGRMSSGASLFKLRVHRADVPYIGGAAKDEDLVGLSEEEEEGSDAEDVEFGKRGRLLDLKGGGGLTWRTTLVRHFGLSTAAANCLSELARGSAVVRALRLWGGVPRTPPLMA